MNPGVGQYRNTNDICIFVEVIEDWNKPTSLSHHLLALLILCQLDKMNPKQNHSECIPSTFTFVKRNRYFLKLICYVHADRKKKQRNNAFPLRFLVMINNDLICINLETS